MFARGFAYIAGRKYDTGMFRGKTAMVSATTGTSADTYSPDGVDGDILSVLWPIHNGLLRYCGFEVIEPFVAYMPGRVGPRGGRPISTPIAPGSPTSTRRPGCSSTRPGIMARTSA